MDLKLLLLEILNNLSDELQKSTTRKKLNSVPDIFKFCKDYLHVTTDDWVLYLTICFPEFRLTIEEFPFHNPKFNCTSSEIAKYLDRATSVLSTSVDISPDLKAVEPVNSKKKESNPIGFKTGKTE